MAKTKEQKQVLLDQYKEFLKDNPNYFIVNTDRVTMPQITEIKKALQETGGSFYVVKNTLFKIAAEEAGQPDKLQEIDGPTGVVVCGEDPTAPARALKDIQKEHQVMDAKAGVLFGEYTDADKVKALAEIPTRDVLLAKLVGTMNAPLSGLASVLKGNVRKFVLAVSEIQKTKAA